MYKKQNEIECNHLFESLIHKSRWVNPKINLANQTELKTKSSYLTNIKALKNIHRYKDVRY